HSPHHSAVIFRFDSAEQCGGILFRYLDMQELGEGLSKILPLIKTRVAEKRQRADGDGRRSDRLSSGSAAIDAGRHRRSGIRTSGATAGDRNRHEIAER